MYSKKNLTGHFYKTKGFYVFYIPVKVPYKKIYAFADSAGLKTKQAFGPILEKGKMFGFGWIGVEVEKPKQQRDDVVHVAGDFDMHEHKGPYKKIMQERPDMKECYNLYLDDPEKVRPENCRTQIYFR
jgi:hypothetical protein